jgi:hypothetical protein
MWMCSVAMVSFRLPYAIANDVLFLIMQCKMYLPMELAAYPVSSAAVCVRGHMLAHIHSEARQCVWSLAPF